MLLVKCVVLHIANHRYVAVILATTTIMMSLNETNTI